MKPNMGLLIAKMNPSLFTVRKGTFVDEMTYWNREERGTQPAVDVDGDYNAMQAVLLAMGAKYYEDYWTELVKIINARTDVHVSTSPYGAAVVQINATPEDMAEAYLRAKDAWPDEWDEAWVEDEEEKKTMFLSEAQVPLLMTKASEFEARGLRHGQSLMNALHEIDKALYSDITGTEADCFYLDARVDAFWRRLIEPKLE